MPNRFIGVRCKAKRVLVNSPPSLVQSAPGNTMRGKSREYTENVRRVSPGIPRPLSSTEVQKSSHSVHVATRTLFTDLFSSLYLTAFDNRLSTMESNRAGTLSTGSACSRLVVNSIPIAFRLFQACRIRSETEITTHSPRTNIRLRQRECRFNT